MHSPHPATAIPAAFLKNSGRGDSARPEGFREQTHFSELPQHLPGGSGSLFLPLG